MTLDGPTGQVLGAAWRPDGTQLATCGLDQTLRTYSAVDGKPIKTATVAVAAAVPQGELGVAGATAIALRGVGTFAAETCPLLCRLGRTTKHHTTKRH